MTPAGPERLAPLRAEPAPVAAPRLAPGVELLGPYKDSGLENPPYLVRRGGTVLQVSGLLHVVAAGMDGSRQLDEIAALAGAELDRQLSADDIRHLVETKLVPAGIVAPDGEPVDAPSPPPAADERLLALRFRWGVLGPQDVDAAARLLGGLFRPAVLAGILAAVVGFDGWLFAVHGVGDALAEILREPALLLFILALTCLSGAFHELGHAAACRYSGARPGMVGAGIYLIWPVLFTDVTDAYRLGRVGRLRTDLGGIYFNAVFVAGLACAYFATGFEPLLAAVVVQHAAVLDQLMPWVRFDGYYVISDLTGVPDILDRVRPALRSVIPGRRPDPEILALRPESRRLLLAYLGSLVVFVAVAGVTTVWEGPGLFATEWHSLLSQLHHLRAAIGMWDLPVGVLVTAQIALLALPTAGLALLLGSLAARARDRRSRPLTGRATRTGALRSA